MMKIVIQCASSKQLTAATLVDASGTPVRFCAEPSVDAHASTTQARPDDCSNGSRQTWRDQLINYNQQFARTGENPLGLLPAGALYTPSAYTKLRTATPDFFVLSAGWGLVRSSYLIPDYDITFSKNSEVPQQNRRDLRKARCRSPYWKDFDHLSSDVPPNEEVHFFGSKEYLVLFYALAEPERRRGKIVIHHKAPVRQIEGCLYEPYLGATRTNWHYVALSDFLAHQ